jgi:tetratricopeptide (TPR) repeat protein
MDQGELEAAEEILNQSLELDPTNTASITTLANLYYRVGKTEKAARYYQRTLELKPDDRWANSGLGIVKHYQGAYREAVTYFEKALQAAPAEHSLWGRMGESYRMIEGREAEAARVFNRALELVTEQRTFDPEDWRTAGFRALYLAYLGRFDDAQAAVAEMFALNPGREPMTHYWAALVSYEAGDVDRAFAELDLALRDGFSEQKRFISEEPALQSLRTRFPERYQAMLDRY